MTLIHIYDAPCGRLAIGSNNDNLCICDWISEQSDFDILIRNKIIRYRLNTDINNLQSDILEKAVAQLDEYFTEKRSHFDIPLTLSGTDFQQKVWNCLLTIPYGETTTYKDIAQSIGKPTATRAVARAIGNNRINIFIPCHRVIGSDGSLTGYRGGLKAKEFLLKLENAQTPFLKF